MIQKIFTLLIVCCLTTMGFAQIADGSFEGGTPNTSWTEASTNFGTPICDLGTCGNCGGPCAPRTGSFYVWFGGAGALEVGSVEQSVTIPSGTMCYITMWVAMPNPGPGLAADKMDVKVDGNTLLTITSGDSATYQGGYVEVMVDISAYCDGSSHTLTIEGTESTADIFNVIVDDVAMEVDGVGVGIIDFGMSETFEVFPNPTQSMITFDVNFNDFISASVHDASGKVVAQFDQPINEIDVADFADGVYYLEIHSDKTTYQSKFIKY